MVSISGCGTNEERFFSLAPREYKIDQLYAEGTNLRAAQQLTRDQRIAIEEHRQFHEKLGDFGSVLNLNEHITLMIVAIKAGMSFIESHMWALQVGPKPN